MKRIALILGLTMLLAASITAAAASSASAATIGRDTFAVPFSETNVSHDCRPGVTGTVQGTETWSYQSVETPEGFHIAGSIVASGRIDWSDGTYTIIGSVDRFAWSFVGNGTEVRTNAHVDTGDFYSADGALEFQETFHLVEHVTITTGDVARIEFERDHFHFSGDC